MSSAQVKDPRCFEQTACVVVPMYNEAAVVGAVIRDLRSQFELVICVDDGSHDDSASIADNAGAVVVRHEVNLGQGAALRTGIDYALCEPAVQHIITFDADGQHNAPDAVALLTLARQAKVDVVLGSRFLGAKSAIPRGRRLLLLSAILFTRITTGLRLTDTHNGLRVFSRSAARRLNLRQPGMAHASEILARIAQLKLSYLEASVSVNYDDYSRAKGQANLNTINILHELALAHLRTAP